MGKGDKKSRRGKLFQGSYGVRRRKKSNKSHTPARSLEIKEPVKEIKNTRDVKDTRSVKDIKEVKEPVKEVREPVKEVKESVTREPREQKPQRETREGTKPVKSSPVVKKESKVKRSES